MEKKIKILITILLVIIVALFIYFMSRNNTPRLDLTGIAPGEQIYDIYTDNPSSFQIIKASFSPLDVSFGKKQLITVFVEDKENNPITKQSKVEAMVYTDNKETPVILSLKQADGPDLVTRWEGLWKLNDSYNKNYNILIKAESLQGESSVNLFFR